MYGCIEGILLIMVLKALPQIFVFQLYLLGELTTSTLLDRELKSKYHLVVKATDGGGRFCQMEIIVHVEDTNDNAPRFYPSNCAVAIYDNTSIKTPIAVVFAKDPDESKSFPNPKSYAVVFNA